MLRRLSHVAYFLQCHCTFPGHKSPRSKHPIVLGRYQVATKIEQIVYSRVHTEETLRLPDRFEATHTSLPYSRWLMRKLCPVVGILACIMNRLRNEVLVRNTIVSQLVRNDPSWFSLVIVQ